MNKSVSEWFSRFTRRGEEIEQEHFLCPAHRLHQENNINHDVGGDEKPAPKSNGWNPPALIPVQRTSKVLAERQGLLVQSGDKSTREDIYRGNEDKKDDSCTRTKKGKLSRGKTVVQLDNEQTVPIHSNDGFANEESTDLSPACIKGTSSLRESMSKLRLIKRPNDKLIVEAGPLALHKEIRRQKQRNTALEKTIENLGAENRGYQDRLDAVVEVHAHLRSENEQKQLKMEELEELSRQLKHQNDELQNGASEAERNATFQNLLLELRKQITGLKKAVSDSEREVASLKDQLCTATDEKAGAMQELDNAQKRITSMERERKIVLSMQKNIEREQYSARSREAINKVEISLGVSQPSHLDSGLLRKAGTCGPALHGSDGLTAGDQDAELGGQVDENDENVPPVKPFVGPASSNPENRVLQY